MNRKTLIAISLIIAIILGVGAYFLFSKKTTQTKPGAAFPGESGPATGRTPATPETPETPTEEAFVPGSSAPLPRLYELHKLPVAGVGLFETGSVIHARYIERGLGHIFQTPLATFIESRIVNETRPRIMEALWGNGGKSVVVRFIDDKEGGAVIKTSILSLDSPESRADSTSTTPISEFIKTEEILLPDYIPFMATSEDKSDKVFYLEKILNASTGSISTFKGQGTSVVLNTAFTEWLPQFPNSQLITLTTRPSATVPGHLFFVDTKTKAITKILGGVNGLTTLTSHDGKLVLFSETRDSAPRLHVYDVKSKTEHSLSIQTLPEKCVWSQKESFVAYCAVPQTIPSNTAIYPDRWYQGLVSFSDSIWKIDTVTDISQKIMTPSEFGGPSMDITNSSLSSNDSYVVFMNKTTGTPWVYRIGNEVSASNSTFPVEVPINMDDQNPQTKRAPSGSSSGMKLIK